jgi:protein O-GlcNAc transferase
VRGQPKRAAAPGAQLDQLRRAVRLTPGNAQAHAALGVALQIAGQLELAVASQRRALELNPGLSALHAVLATALHALGQHEAAVASFRQALTMQGDNGALHKGMADALFSLGQLDASVASGRRAVALCPDNADCHFSLATALSGLRDHEPAMASYRNTLALQPDHFYAHANLASILQLLGQFAPAAARCRLALNIRPDDLSTRRRLCILLRQLGKYQESLEQSQIVLSADPDNAQSHFDVAQAWNPLGEVDLAMASLKRALEIDADHGPVHTYLASILMSQGKTELAMHSLRRTLETNPDSATAHSNLLFNLSHTSSDAAELFAEHSRFGARFAALAEHWAPHTNQRDPERCLQVGIVSGDFCNHAVVSFIEPVLELLAHSPQFSLHGYSNRLLEDHATARLRGYFAHWQPIAALDDDAVERQIRADGIDILIDLSGHSALNRLPLFARKPAPVQASWIGYSGTTGLRAMDYYLSDHNHFPPGRYDAQFTEQIVRMPLGAAFLPELSAPDVNPLPALSNGYLTFGSFNRAEKLSQEVIGLWAQLLRAVPSARLLLAGLSSGADTPLLDWFADEGIDPARLILHPRCTLYEYLALHHKVDVCLAPFPYTGATTVCHALWMGVPTLTVIGPTTASHGAACYMTHVGLDSFIAEDGATLVKLGAFLADNLDELAGLRDGMRERFNASVVGHPVIVAASLERALRLMWQRWCADLPPAPLQVRLADLVDASGPASGS